MTKKIENTYPKTATEWWKIVDTNWNNIELILERFLTKKDFAAAKAAKKIKNGELPKYFDKAYDKAPDNIMDEKLPGWIVMCDLCDDDHVLHHIDSVAA